MPLSNLSHAKKLEMRLLIFIAVLFAACTSSKKDKFITAIKEAEEIYFRSHGEKVESLEIDSLNYSEATMKDFYDMETNRQLNLVNESRSAIAAMGDQQDSVQIRKMEDEDNKRQKVFSKIEALMDLPSVANRLYRVNYYINAKTDKGSYAEHREKFLTPKELKEIKLDDSFFN